MDSSFADWMKAHAVVLQDAEHDFRIDEILGAAEADESCFQKTSSSRYIKHKGRNPRIPPTIIFYCSRTSFTQRSKRS